MVRSIPMQAAFKQDRSGLGIPVAISLLVHLLLVGAAPSLLSWRPSAVIPSARTGEKILRIRLNQMKDLSGQVVDLADPLPSEAKAPDNARFLGEKNRTVERETQARFTGPNPNSAIGRPGTGRGSRPHRGSGKYDLSLPEKFLNGPARSGGGMAAARAPSNYLPEIRFGDETLLNMKEYAFSSFFNRVKRQMEPFWHPLEVVRQNGLTKDQYTTVVSIALNEDGSLDDVQVIQSSGNQPFDQEALAAVKRAAPYLNPPKELLETDGRLHIPTWGFVLTNFVLF